MASYRSKLFDTQLHFGSGSKIDADDIPDSETRTWITKSLQWISGSKILADELNLGTNKIINVVDPTNPQDAVTLKYLDTALSGSTYTLQTVTEAGPYTNHGIQVDASGSQFYNLGITSGSIDMFNHNIIHLANPTADYDAVNKFYVDTISGSLEVLGIPADGTYSDGLLSFTPVTQVRNAIDDLNEVLSYLAPSPPAALSGTLTDNITTYSGKISVNTLNLIDYSAGDTAVVSYNAALTLTAPNSTKFDEADIGTLACYMDDALVESYDLAAAFVEGERAGAQSYPPDESATGYVDVLTAGWYNDFPMWQKGTARLQIGATYGNSDMAGGEHNFTMKHGSDATNETQLYYDPESGRPYSVETPTIAENSKVVRYLSGVQFYTTDATFDVSGSCDRVFEYTYIDSPIRFTMTGINTLDMAWVDASVDNVHSPIPYWDDVLGFFSKTITINDANEISLDARLTVNPRDPKGSGTTIQTASANRLIDTYGTNSTTVRDYFNDENRRQPSGSFDTVPAGVTGQWDSTAVLTDGNAQVVSGQVIYPVTNWSSGYLPAQGGSTDYSGFVEEQVYFRTMYESGAPHFAGSLKITGIVWADLGVDVDLELRLPTETGWLDMSVAYNAGSFTGAHGDGVMTSYSQLGDVLTINWTVGSKTTANSGYMYIVRILMKNMNEPITELYEAGW